MDCADHVRYVMACILVLRLASVAVSKLQMVKSENSYKVPLLIMICQRTELCGYWSLSRPFSRLSLSSSWTSLKSDMTWIMYGKDTILILRGTRSTSPISSITSGHGAKYQGCLWGIGVRGSSSVCVCTNGLPLLFVKVWSAVSDKAGPPSWYKVTRLLVQ